MMMSIDEIALYFLGGMPEAISHRIIRDLDWQSGVGINGLVGVVEYAGKCRLGEILDTARKVYETREPVFLLNLEDEAVEFVYFNSVVCVASHGEKKFEPPVAHPALGLVSPDLIIRLANFKKLNTSFGATGPAPSKWEPLLKTGSLSNHSVSELYDEIGSSVPNWWHFAKEALSNNRAVLSDLVPEFPEYWTGLVGPKPNELDVTAYCEGPLRKHRISLIENNFADALSLILPGCLDENTDLLPEMLEENNDTLFDICERNQGVPDPYSLMGLAALTAKLGRTDDRFDKLSATVIERLSSDELPRNDGTDVWAIFPFILRACFVRVRQIDGFTAQPPYWLWLCAFTHAGLLIRLLDQFSLNPIEMEKWAENFYDDWNITADCVAIHREPSWRSDCLEQNNLQAELAGRLGHLLNAEQQYRQEVPFKKQIEDVLDATFKKGRWPFLPGPLEGYLRQSDRTNLLPFDEDVEKNFREKLSNRDAGVWPITLVLAQVYNFTDEHFGLIENALEQTVKYASSSEDYFDALYCVSVIAALYQRPLLSEKVALFLPKSLNTENDARTAFLISIAASAAISDGSRTEWLSEKLIDVAYRDMSTEAALYLGNLLNSLVCFFPIEHWEFGRASAACMAMAYETPQEAENLVSELQNRDDV
jgi:hypothetical protein